VSRVYLSLPLRGPSGRAGREVARGAELALEAGQYDVAPILLDSSGDDREAKARSNAAEAAADEDAVAYLGDFHSSQVLETAPILADAGLLQVAPVATFAGLGGKTLVRLMPHDGVGAEAIAAWLEDAGVRELLVVHDHDDGYGVPVGAMCASAARDRGLDVHSRPIWDHDEPWAGDIEGAEAFLYVGVPGSGAPELWRTLHRANPDLWLLGSEGLARDWFARELEPSAAERTRFFVAARGPLALYGYEAMALIGDAVAANGADRAAVLETIRATRDRDSIIGRYSIDGDGHTTSSAYGRMAVVDGELVWDLSSEASISSA
jgi:branched-chain amino acid transport system substrate-binding protein